MNRRGDIVIIEDDLDDQAMFSEVFADLHCPNQIVFIDDGEAALEYLMQVDQEPFIVFSDINMPKLNGIELRELIHKDESICLKCLPYIFFTTTTEPQHVQDAYSKSIQGVFIKPSSYCELRNTIRVILEYWMTAISPEYIKERKQEECEHA